MPDVDEVTRLAGQGAGLPPTVILHDDARISIEHKPRAGGSKTLVITFDPLLYLADKPYFAKDFLDKELVDVVAVRKKDENFYQALSRQSFEDALRPLLAHYTRVIAYGSSLGAYAALYFCRDIDCQVIASSPRVSAHPVYGVEAWQKKVPFLHERFSALQPVACRAFIFYDPKDAIDQRFIEAEVLPQFPAATVLRMAYSGHPANQVLSEIGFIAPFVRAAIAARKLPEPNFRNRHAAPTYLVTLAQACIKHHKLSWADALVARALLLKPAHASAFRTRGHAAMCRKDWAAAKAALTTALELSPADSLAAHWLKQVEARLTGSAPVARKPSRKLLSRSWSRLRSLLQGLLPRRR